MTTLFTKVLGSLYKNAGSRNPKMQACWPTRFPTEKRLAQNTTTPCKRLILKIKLYFFDFTVANIVVVNQGDIIGCTIAKQLGNVDIKFVTHGMMM